MPSYIDIIGEWEELSSSPVTVTDTWLVYPGILDGNLLKLRFSTDWAAWNHPTGYRSFAWLRTCYENANTNEKLDLVTPARRIYPKQEEMLIQIASIPETDNVPGLLKRLELRRIRQRYPTPKLSSGELLNYDSSSVITLDWQISIDYLK